MGEKRKKSHKNINSVDNDWPLKQQNKANGNEIYLESGELSLTKNKIYDDIDGGDNNNDSEHQQQKRKEKFRQLKKKKNFSRN